MMKHMAILILLTCVVLFSMTIVFAEDSDDEVMPVAVSSNRYLDYNLTSPPNSSDINLGSYTFLPVGQAHLSLPGYSNYFPTSISGSETFVPYIFANTHYYDWLYLESEDDLGTIGYYYVVRIYTADGEPVGSSTHATLRVLSANTDYYLCMYLYSTSFTDKDTGLVSYDNYEAEYSSDHFGWAIYKFHTGSYGYTVDSSGWTAIGFTSMTWVPEADLPVWVSYTGNGSFELDVPVTDTVYWLYNLGGVILDHIDGVSDFLSLKIGKYTFFSLLIVGFVVYAGWVIVKWAVPV